MISSMLILTSLRSSSTVTFPSPLQSPAHVNRGAVGVGVDVAVGIIGVKVNVGHSGGAQAHPEPIATHAPGPHEKLPHDPSVNRLNLAGGGGNDGARIPMLQRSLWCRRIIPYVVSPMAPRRPRHKSLLLVMSIVSCVVVLLGSSGGASGLLGPMAVNVTVQRCGECPFGVLICVGSAVAVN